MKTVKIRKNWGSTNPCTKVINPKSIYKRKNKWGNNKSWED